MINRPSELLQIHALNSSYKLNLKPYKKAYSIQMEKTLIQILQLILKSITMGIRIRMVKEKELENNMKETSIYAENGILVNYMAAVRLNVNMTVIGAIGRITKRKDMEQ